MTPDQKKVLRRLAIAERDKPYGVLIEGYDKIICRQLERMGFTRFIDLYHGDQFWRATEAGMNEFDGQTKVPPCKTNCSSIE